MKIRIFLGFLLILLILGATQVVAKKITISGTSTPKEVYFKPVVPHPVLPANLVIDQLQFSDTNNNEMIDASEDCLITFDIVNRGEGAAYDIEPNIELGKMAPYIHIPPSEMIPTLLPGDRYSVKINITADKNIPSDDLELRVLAIEGNGFNTGISILRIKSCEYLPPKILIADAKFSSRQGGIPRIGEVITLQMLVQNQGFAEAEDVSLRFTLPEHVFPGAKNLDFALGNINKGEYKTIELLFFANNEFASDRLSIVADLTEKYDKYAEKGKILSVDMKRNLSRTVSLEVLGKSDTTILEKASLHADVDINIPESPSDRKHVFALIIGNESYSTVQQSEREIDVPFARNDAIIFKEYVNKTLGVPNENITLLTDASKVMMWSEIERLCRIAATYPEKEKPEIIFYYAGHGMYDALKAPYLIPIDVTGSQVKRGIRLERLYQELSKANVHKAAVFIDACFSGGARGGTILAARGIRLEPNLNAIDGNLVVLSAASGSQVAYSYPEKQHGMFTYYLLKKMQETKGDVTFQDLSDYVRKSVVHQSYKINNAEQTPVTLIGIGADQIWSQWLLK